MNARTPEQVAALADRLDAIAERARRVGFERKYTGIRKTAAGLREGIRCCPAGTPWWTEGRWADLEEHADRATAYLDLVDGALAQAGCAGVAITAKG